MKYLPVLLSLLYSVVCSSQLYVNEAMSSNKTIIADEAGQYDDWFEIYNSGGSAIDLQSYFLSDNPSDLMKWEVEASVVVPAGGFVLFWADEDQSQGDTHTNFKLSSLGETIYLSSPSGVLINSLDLPELQDDFSFGRVSDGSNAVSNFSTSSPNDTNANGISRVSEVIFSVAGGIHNNSVSLSLSTNTSGATIRYTTDGSEPTSSSPTYSSAINITDVTTIRAVAFKSGFEESITNSESYLVGISHTLPIVAINTNPDNLWDDEIGIYVEGTNGIDGNCSSDPRNWNQPWERPANVQFFDENGNLGFNIDAGISIAGGCSRNNAQKGMNIETKSIYPSENIPYQLFPNREQDEYRRFKLRAGGNDWEDSMLRDASAQAFIEDEVDVDMQSSRHVVVYLNSEYWGVMNIRDTHSRHSINYKHPKVDKDSINLFKPDLHEPVELQGFEIKSGQANDFLNLYNFIKNNDLKIASNYDYVSSKIDINEFTNYMIFQLFIANTDWPSNNLDVWHEQNGKARWLLYDTDWGLGFRRNVSNNRQKNPPEVDAISRATQQTDTGWPNGKAATVILYKIIQNSTFQDEFIQRYATQLDILFNSNRTTGIVNDLRDIMEPEMQEHLDRWNLNGSNISNWHTDVNQIVNWLNDRPDYVYTNIENFFNLSGTYTLTIPVTSATNGRVLLNSNKYLAPLNYSAKYFENVPVMLTAVANPGYRFSHWQETGDTDASINVTYNTNKTLTPVFVSSEDVVINEIYYNPLGSSENGEFIEIYNPGAYPRDLSGLVFTDAICFEFPLNTTINPGEYILIANDASVYQGNGYQVFEWEDSSLSNGGEHIQISTETGFVIDSLSYNDGASWSKTADNGFYSLALLDTSFDNGVGDSWDVQSTYITPGAENQFLPYDTFHLPSDIVINEIHYHPFDSITPAGDTLISKNYEFIELKNLTNSPISLDGVALTRGIVYEFPSGSVLPPNGFVVISEDSLLFHERYNFYPMGVYEGKLSNSGELVWLADQSGNLLDAVKYDDVFPWDAQADGGSQDFSLALIDPSLPNDTHINWLHQCTMLHTPLEENDFGCFQGQTTNGLSINEIHYAPTGGANFEYIELYNSSFTIIELEGMTFSNGLTFTFGNTLMFPNSYVVVARDSATFHNTYGFAPDGDYEGSLNNTGETIQLRDFFGNLIDEVLYSSTAPWETQAAQGAHSLALIDHTLDNGLASSWCIQDINVSPRQANSFGDSDSDGLIDCVDTCPLLDDSLIGTACDDGDPCTVGETYSTNCDCTGGVFLDSDNDGVCDLNDQCNGLDDSLIGTPCDDGNVCTSGEIFNSNCQCTGGIETDSDSDGVCDVIDQCPNFNDNLIGQPCDDGIACTIGATYATDCACTGGVLQDADNDGICDSVDQCPGTDDSIIGTSCDDSDPCTINDQYDSSCNCAGQQSPDTDNDGVCDAIDQCPMFNDNLIGQPCDDGIICFVGSTWDANCNCTGGAYVDSDGDMICDPLDECPGSDDRIDVNSNGIPDGCEGCSDYITESNNPVISQDRSANISISTNGRVFTGDLDYSAGQEVIMTSGFEVKSGAVFHAYIAPCN